MTERGREMWNWIREQVDKHFADVCLLVLVFSLLFVVMAHVALTRSFGGTPQPENVGWARDTISAIIGCLLGRLSKMDLKSNGGTDHKEQ